MNREVSLQTAKLLKEKEFDRGCTSFYDLVSNQQIENAPLGNYNLTSQSVSIPTLDEVKWWFYEKRIWIVVNVNIEDKWYFEMFDLGSKRNAEILADDEYCFDSPGEAYDAAFKEALKKLR